MNRIKTTVRLLFLAFICIIVMSSNLYAQVGTDTSSKNKISIVKADTAKADTEAEDYNNIVFTAKLGNNFTYRGLSAEKMPYLSPDITYNAKSGFWVSLTAYRVWSTEAFAKKFLETDVALGWDFNFFKYWDLSLAYTRGNYDTSSVSPVKSALANNIGFYTGYDFGPIYFGMRYDYTFERKTVQLAKKTKTIGFSDYYLNWDLYKDIGWANMFFQDDEFHIIPDVNITGGTQSVYSSYLEALTAKRAKVRNALVVKTIKQPSTFSIFLFNFSLPIAYYIGNWKIKPEYDLYYFTTKGADGKREPPYSLYSLKVAYTLNFKGKKGQNAEKAKGIRK